MIPDLIDVNGVWEVLPPGIHDATMQEVEQKFATNETRSKLLAGFRLGAENLRRAGCKVIYLDGSFVTEKFIPGDFDACWDPVGVDANKLDPVLLDFSHGRKQQKLKYGGEFFLSSIKADGVLSFLDFFQIDKFSGDHKGIIRIQLS